MINSCSVLEVLDGLTGNIYIFRIFPEMISIDAIF